MDIYEIVKARHSVRSYTDKKIEGDTLDKLNSEIKECIEESNLNIQLILNEENAFGKSHYGNFKNCRNYILIIGDKKDNKLDEKAGYYGERIVLKAERTPVFPVSAAESTEEKNFLTVSEFIFP